MYKIKRIILGIAFSIFSTSTMLSAEELNLDDFLLLLQFSTIQTASKGQYSATQAGQSRFEDPKDWYTPKDLADFFAMASGDRTSTNTFYGICFDYAFNLYNTLWEASIYEEGLFDSIENISEVFVAATSDDPNIISLYEVPRGQWGDGRIYSDWYDLDAGQLWGKKNNLPMLNGVYVKYRGFKRVKAHLNACNHAWVWVLDKDGTWFWLDPTYTDNTGFIYFGYVKNEEEVFMEPDQRLTKQKTQLYAFYNDIIFKNYFPFLNYNLNNTVYTVYTIDYPLKSDSEDYKELLWYWKMESNEIVFSDFNGSDLALELLTINKLNLTVQEHYWNKKKITEYFESIGLEKKEAQELSEKFDKVNHGIIRYMSSNSRNFRIMK